MAPAQIEAAGRSLIVAFRPQLVTSAAIAAAFGSILRQWPDRIVLSFGRSAGPPEIYADVDRAISRMEQIVEACQLPALHSGIIADRRPLDELAKGADGRAAELLRAWATGPTDWSLELLGKLKAAGLLADRLGYWHVISSLLYVFRICLKAAVAARSIPNATKNKTTANGIDSHG